MESSIGHICPCHCTISGYFMVVAKTFEEFKQEVFATNIDHHPNMDGMKTYFYLDRPGAGDLIAITNEEEFQQAFLGEEWKYVPPFLNNSRPHPKDFPFQIHHFKNDELVMYR